MLKPLPYQEKGIAFLRKRRGAILADDMGVGKTMQAIIAAQPAIGLRVIVCPRPVVTNWAREIVKWGGEGAIGTVTGTKRDTDQHALCEWIIIPYSVAHIRLAEIPDPEVVICDEAHVLKNPQTKRSTAIKHLCDRARRVWLLTGTPVQNRPLELWTLLDLIGLPKREQWAEQWRYKNKFCAPQKFWNGRKYVMDYRGASNLPELHMRLKNAKMLLRRMKKNVVGELPQKTRNTVWIDAPIGQMDARDMPERAAALMHAVKVSIENENDPDFQALSGVRSDQGKAKADVVAEYVRDTYAEEPVVVMCYHRETAEAIADRLGAPCIHGAVTHSKREDILDTFKAGGSPYLVATIGTLGTGVDGLQHVCRHALFAELSWVPAELAQAEDRFWRLGQACEVTITYLLAEGSLDQMLWESIQAKLRMIAEIY